MNRILLITLIILLSIVFATGLSCDDESEETPVITATPAPTLNPTPSTPMPTPATEPNPTHTTTPTVTAVPTPSPIVTPTAQSTPTATVTPTEAPLPTRDSGSCTPDRDEIQVALDTYYAENGEWPTIDGQPGDIEWAKLIPGFLDGVPYTDKSCEWQVDDDPEGAVCLLTPC